jgi:tetratricopeptide (TPR) repeat protein
MSALPAMLRRALPPALCLLLACDGGAAGAGDAPPAADPAAFDAARVRAVRLQDGGGETSEVLAALLEAHKLDTRHPGVNRRLAQLYADLKLHEQALHHFELLHAAQPSDNDVLLSIVTLQVRLGLLDGALANLPPLLADKKLRGDGLYQQATILELQDRRADAEALLADLSGLTPEQAYRCLSLRGRYAFERGDWEAAAPEFAAALTGRPDYKEALRGAADCARRLGREEEAQHWDEVLQNFIVLTDNIFIDTPKAAPQKRAALEKLVVIYPAWGEGFMKLAEIQQRAGERDAACATVRAFLAAHGEKLAPAERTRMKEHYCGVGD